MPRKSNGLTAFRSTLLAGCAGVALTGTALLVPTTIGAELPAGTDSTELDRVYLGWDAEGVPTPETLQRLGIG